MSFDETDSQGIGKVQKELCHPQEGERNGEHIVLIGDNLECQL